ncbi:hypothetical protein JOM56_008753 [Amanita muscaria]
MSQPVSQAFINALLLDGFFQSFLLGTVVVQACQYWSDCKGDAWRKRMFVATVVLFSILQTILEDYKVFRSLAYNRIWSTSAIQWSDFFLNGCICSMCQAFYIDRCWVLTEKRRWILVPLSALLLVTIVANISLAVVIGIAFRGLDSTTYDLLNVSRNLLPSTICAFTLWMSGTLVLDVCITVTVVIALWRSKTGSLQSDRVIHRLIMITWESAALPSILTIVSAALYRAMAYAYDHVVILLVLQTGKLYTIGMLRSLNLRAELGHKLSTFKHSSKSIPIHGGMVTKIVTVAVSTDTVTQALRRT